ncbi:MAG: FAD binding domain-containing protein [Proteobacteria bacterium]|nr:FAD binding domain-containing protein [Pseudomonadota bacterium]
MGRWYRPTRLSDALAALAEQRWTVVAGGTDHYPARLGQPRHEDVLDISALRDLRRIEAGPEGWTIPCGATWTDLIRADLPPAFDGLRAAARQVGGVQIQNRATLIGNLCNASPAADGTPNLLALDAQVVLESAGGRRMLPVQDFVLGSRRTARREDELATGVFVPAPQPGARGAFLKLGARRYLVISIAMVALVLDQAPDGRVRHAGVAVGACNAAAMRLAALEAALAGHLPSRGLLTSAHLAPLAPIDDVRGPASYRMDAAFELIARGIDQFAAARVAA